MHFPSVERFGVERHRGGVAALGTVDGHFAAQLHPRHGEDGAGVGGGQREDVLLIVLQEVQDAWGRSQRERSNLVRVFTSWEVLNKMSFYLFLFFYLFLLYFYFLNSVAS